MAEFTMPSLGADMTEGTLIEWLVGPGDRVRKGDIVAVVDTTKSAIEVECFESGVVDRLLVETGATVPVGTSLAVISPAGEEAAGLTPEAPEAVSRKQPASPPAAATTPPPPSASPEAGQSGGTVAATPLVRHQAEEAGLDLAAVHGTGPGGRVTRADVSREAAAERPPSTAVKEEPAGRGRVRATPLARRTAAETGIELAAVTGTGRDGAVRVADVRAAAAKRARTAPESVAGQREALLARPEAAGAGPHKAETGRDAATTVHDAAARLTAMRRTTADLMTRSKREIPHYYLSTTVDLGRAVAWLRERNRELPVPKRLVTTAVLLKATALAARHVPQLNGFWTPDGFGGEAAVHLGVAVSLRGGGLVAPAIRDAADLPLPEVMARLRDLVARARTGRLRASETASATITVTNLGDQGVEAVFGVIYPPQVALVGLGKVVERPWAVNGLLGVRPVVTATLSADHRASDGSTGARFLAALDSWAQKPEEL
ncbi:dihydrolipoamide acetyltransferase family protein [Actinacidiphila bryophytorum]|uniref:Dihydrolipoamide acetyltransferase component of pyruvate dehydrogenase complex n=1 Tax=Actinacidiphila bryophytorum TaxID=1436133 RepID=A0A9W4GXW2_9ACTN|nr:dihydrolipoamide acetyltransferase family protein [Actinacidiphila bryophytorum]MBM9438420.1 2-oxo acid dehydrogenase subunit E2 [Actinacidiphila bryophytorum]MBN6542306.1 2-oxo acid dehydrogenase subunit E2 [Actinacidiphila bryophytorum]CAG7613770.1 Dihydrolipoamide acetyltransferase component of pyruvate dehydrogenase complex [Actinacidiphila bryophytorum]